MKIVKSKILLFRVEALVELKLFHFLIKTEALYGVLHDTEILILIFFYGFDKYKIRNNKKVPHIAATILAKFERSD